MHQHKHLPGLHRICDEYCRGHLSSPGRDKHFLIGPDPEGRSVDSIHFHINILGGHLFQHRRFSSARLCVPLRRCAAPGQQHEWVLLIGGFRNIAWSLKQEPRFLVRMIKQSVPLWRPLRKKSEPGKPEPGQTQIRFSKPKASASLGASRLFSTTPILPAPASPITTPWMLGGYQRPACGRATAKLAPANPSTRPISSVAG